MEFKKWFCYNGNWIGTFNEINIIISFNMAKNGIKINFLRKCIRDKQAKQFKHRWMDTTRSALLFSKGNILV